MELGTLSANQLLDELETVDRQRSAIEARRLEIMARYHEVRSRDGEWAARSVPTEIGITLNISAGHAEHQLRLAQNLTQRLPDTLQALHHGRIDLPKARAIAEITGPLSLANAREVEAKVLPKAGERTLVRVRDSARYHRDRVDPAAAEQRRQQAKAARDVSFEPVDDGSAELLVRGPADRVYLAWQVIDTLARRIRGAGDQRPLHAIRHDITLDLLLGKQDSRVQVQVYLHVPATTAAGITTDPGILAGYGAVTRTACQELAARDAVWQRVFNDPITGTVKDVDRRSYRPPEALAQYIAVRDGTCVGPGCTRSAHACQIDHSIRWADGGGTFDGNLEPLCWPDHRLKEKCGWTLIQREPGDFVWISPVGQRHHRPPESLFD